ncbi:conserved Plasmodium protein, unknown function [Plasmodium malariae]|uniref:Uncharacterized protein n=1 Tax=Plasmodium malariae TaxID=5858 RepID=A0A1A8WT32_PLAMA|nr:conserved Plasmodium protein, unknown function [Plasmodium malariae]SBS96113.1 hypothetical protein PMALA_051310 [Plasmodium malariae]SCO92939.1 conserved Plasmodium protein, unknown function [Plasmodium malariae]
MRLQDGRENINTIFFTCTDISEKDMRKIIIMNNKKNQKKLLLEKLKITFNISQEMKIGEKYKVKVCIDDFLPPGLNTEKKKLKKSTTDIIDNIKEYSLYNPNEGQKKKMKKIICDFFYNILLYCVKKNVSIVEISTYLSIKKYMFFKFVSGSESMINLFLDFKNIMFKHSINRPPHYVKIFSYSSLKMLIKYSLNTFFRNFSFYNFIFRPTYKIKFESYPNDFPDFEATPTTYFDDDNVLCDLNTSTGVDTTKELLRLTVGSINHLHPSEQGEEVFFKELQTYFDKYDIKNKPDVFEIETYNKKDTNMKKFLKDVRSIVINDEEHPMIGKDISKRETIEKGFTKDKLIRRVSGENKCTT